MCRPQFLSQEENNGPYIEFKSLKHPCVASTGITFIPNDVIIGKNGKLREQILEDI
jgi:DNA mismatch repair ATPase MutS